MNDVMRPLSANDRFMFSCSPDVSCFNNCCRDLNQFLTPYDVLRIKRGLKVTSDEFLSTYCLRHTGPRSGLPVVTLKPADTGEATCPFLTAEGCRIYDNRPSSCRMYPLVRAVSRSRQTGALTERYMVLKEPHCRGFDQGDVQTIEEWISHQGLNIYNTFNDLLIEIISFKNRLSARPLDPDAAEMFYQACYDLDTFRTRVFDESFLNGWEPHADDFEKARMNDESLLGIGLEAVKRILSKPRS
ncbi:MAG: YkgJ family cysteine cluster protein [Desulfobacterales bacterium]